MRAHAYVYLVHFCRAYILISVKYAHLRLLLSLFSPLLCCARRSRPPTTATSPSAAAPAPAPRTPPPAFAPPSRSGPHPVREAPTMRKPALARGSQMQGAASLIPRPDGLPSTLRIGIHSGPLVAGANSACERARVSRAVARLSAALFDTARSGRRLPARLCDPGPFRLVAGPVRLSGSLALSVANTQTQTQAQAQTQTSKNTNP